VTLARGAPIRILSVPVPNVRYRVGVLTTAGVVDNLLYNTPDVSIALSLSPISPLSSVCLISRLCAGDGTYVVERAELGGSLVQAGVGREDRAATLTLVANYPTHGDVLVGSRRLSMLNSRRDVVGAIAKFSLIAELLWD
jgi:hypothetical protein